MEHSLLSSLPSASPPSPPPTQHYIAPVEEQARYPDVSDFSFRENKSPASEVRLGATGVDTLKLFFPLRLNRRPDFHVLQRNQTRGRDVGEGYLWRDPTGKLAYGSIAVRRSGEFRFRIGPVGTEIKLRAFFSASTATFGDNTCAITKAELQSALERMESTLYDLGLDVDWREGQISRVDVHRDVSLPRPFHYYLAALQIIEPRYGRIFQNFPTGVLRGAATRLVYNLYDKRAQCLHRAISPPPATSSYPAWLRCEARLPTASAVRGALSIGTAGELVETFDQLQKWLSERIDKDLLNEEVPEYTGMPNMAIPTFTPEDELWWQAQLMGEAEDLRDRLALIALRLASSTIGPQRFWELAKQEDWSQSLQTTKHRKHLRQVAMNSFSDEMIPVAQLYQELRTALLS